MQIPQLYATKLDKEGKDTIYMYMQYCCFPAIVMAKYAYKDYKKHIESNKKVYRQMLKKKINEVGNYLDSLPHVLASLNRQYLNYMNIFGDTIDELLSDETEELYESLKITFKNAKFKDVEIFASLYFIDVMISLAVNTYNRCCTDLCKVWSINLNKDFEQYSLKSTQERWNNICNDVKVLYGYNTGSKKTPIADLQTPRNKSAVKAIMEKYSDIDILRQVMKEAYPWSINYKEGVPYEESLDYIVVNSREQTKAS